MSDRALGRWAAEDDRREMLLGLDRALRGEAEAEQLARQALPERRLCEQEEVVGAAPEDGQRRNQTGLRRQEQCLAGLAGASASTSFETMRCR